MVGNVFIFVTLRKKVIPANMLGDPTSKENVRSSLGESSIRSVRVIEIISEQRVWLLTADPVLLYFSLCSSFTKWLQDGSISEIRENKQIREKPRSGRLHTTRSLEIHK